MSKTLILLLAFSAFLQANAEELPVEQEDTSTAEKNLETKSAKFINDEPQLELNGDIDDLAIKLDANLEANDDPYDQEAPSNDVDAKEENVDVPQNNDEEQDANKKDKAPRLSKRGLFRRNPLPQLNPYRPCGKTQYNIHTQSCCFNRFVRLKGKCPVFHCNRLRPTRISATYNPFTHHCCFGVVYPMTRRCPVHKCGKIIYNPRWLACCHHKHVGYRLYNIYTHKCCNGITIPKCFECHPWGKCGEYLYSTWLYRCCGKYIYSYHFEKCCFNRYITDKQMHCIE